MARLLKLFLSLLLLVACSEGGHLSEEEKIALAEEKWKLITEEDVNFLQGSPKTMNLLEEILRLNPNHCDALREISIPYLKRGMPRQWKKRMDKAVACDPTRWQGWRGYLYLYFYRDYQKAIEDLNATDSLTPNHIDAPQGHSVDYWRGHSYLGLKNYNQSIYYYEKHIAKVVEDFGEEWVEPDAFLNLAIAHYEKGDVEKMLEPLEKALYYYENKSADTRYYFALYEKARGNSDKALKWVVKGIEDFYNGYSKRRNYNEEIKQVYGEQLIALEEELKLLN